MTVAATAKRRRRQMKLDKRFKSKAGKITRDAPAKLAPKGKKK